MRFGSLDPFLLGDPFWQDRMGKPVANLEFLRVLLSHGTFDSYHFFCDDSRQLSQFQASLNQLVENDCLRRVRASLKAQFLLQLRDDSFDIMHQGDFTYHMPHLIELRNRLGCCCPVSGITHSLDGASMHTRFIQLLLAGPKPFDSIICSSRCAVEVLEKAFESIRSTFLERYKASLPEPPELVHIPLGLPERAFEMKSRFECRKELGLPRDHFVVLLLARLSLRHKMDLSPVLEVIHWLDRERALPEFTLVLAGAAKPSDLSLARDLVSYLDLHKRVRLEPNISAEKKQLLYGSSDVFLSMVDNYQETFGLTILEAMAQGLPIVASDFNGYRELVVHGRTGFLIPTSASMSPEPWAALMGFLDPTPVRFHQAQKVAFDLSELARAMVLLASDPQLRQQMGIRARAKALRYRWRAIVPLYEEVWMRQKKQACLQPSPDPISSKLFPMLVPEVGKIFSHYPTRQLRECDEIALSHYGRVRCLQRFQPVLYEDMDVLFDHTCKNHLLQQLLERRWVLADLIEETRLRLGCSGEVVLFHIDWLMKHGYIVPGAENEAR